MTHEELKNAAKEYVQLCVDEIKDEAYDYADEELELGHEQCSIFQNLVQSVKVK